MARAQNIERNVKLITKETPFGKRHNAVNDDFFFSPDGKRLAYWAWTPPTKSKMFVVVNGVAGKPYDYVELSKPRSGTVPPGEISFSPDSRHMAYRGHRGDEWMVVRDGKEEKLYTEKHNEYENNDGTDVIADIEWSPDSRHLAYRARRGNKWIVVSDGKEGKLFDWIADDDLHFSADSKRLAYLAARGESYFIVVDDGASVRESTYRPAAAGKRMVRVLQRGEKELVVLDGRPGKTYDRIFKYTGSHETSIHFSPNGRHVAYVAEIGEKQLVVLDGKEGKMYDRVDELRFSPDSSRFAYVATVVSAAKGYQYFVVLDGQEAAPASEPIDQLTFSPDSQHLAYVLLHYTTQRGIEGMTVVRDGRKERRYRQH